MKTNMVKYNSQVSASIAQSHYTALLNRQLLYVCILTTGNKILWIISEAYASDYMYYKNQKCVEKVLLPL